MDDQSTELTNYADPAMFESEPMVGEGREDIRPRVYLLQATADPLGSLASAAMMYEGRVVRNIEKDVTDDDRRHYWAEANKTHLAAPLEYIDLHFMIEGVTRAFTHQMVRQRTAVYAQESLRFAVKEGFAGEVPNPPSIAQGSPEDLVWKEALDAAETGYELLINMGIPAEDARGLLPHQITTRLNYKTNLRNLADHVGNRLCTQAQFEWRMVATEMANAIRDYMPINRMDEGWQFKLIAESGIFQPVCFQMGRCPFKADFDRDCTIRPRVEEGKFDEIDTAEWLLDPAAARRGIG